MKKISIIVPVYNTKEEYLKKCIKSILDQTIINEIEVIIIDDGSNEKTAQICDKYGCTYENINVIHQKNQGPAISRNNGMKMAKGKWIMFVDSDDWIESNMAEKLLELEQDDIDIIMTSCNLCYKKYTIPVNMFNGENKIWYKNKEKLELQIITSLILGKNSYNAKYLVIPCAKLYRRSFIEKNKLYDVCSLRFKEDNIFNLYCFEMANKIKYKNYCLYNYRQREKSLIHIDDFEVIDLYEEYLIEQHRFIKRFEKTQIFEEAHYIKMVQSIANIVEKYMINSKINYKKQRKRLKELMDDNEFKEALEKVNFKYLSKYLRLIVLLLRHKMYWLSIEIIKVANIIKQDKEGELYK